MTQTDNVVVAPAYLDSSEHESQLQKAINRYGRECYRFGLAVGTNSAAPSEAGETLESSAFNALTEARIDLGRLLREVLLESKTARDEA